MKTTQIRAEEGRSTRPEASERRPACGNYRQRETSTMTATSSAKKLAARFEE